MPTLSMAGQTDQAKCVERRLGERHPKGVYSMDLSYEWGKKGAMKGMALSLVSASLGAHETEKEAFL